MSDVPDSVLEQIQKLFKLASKNTNEHEAQAALNKAQELLTRYNLDYEAVSEARVGSGAREKTAVEGGYYDYEQALWQSVAKLNFCLWWHSREYNRDRKRNSKGYLLKYFYYHNIVGRKVNVAATQAMATYLLQTATRLTHERVRGVNDTYRFDNWANSYKRGIVHRVCEKLQIRRNKALKEELERKSKDQRAQSGASTSTAVSLMTYVDNETDANLDFIYGEGYSAQKAAERAEVNAMKAAEAYRSERRQKAFTKWAEAHPEEAAAMEKARIRHNRKQGRKSSGGRSANNIDPSAFWAGYDTGDTVSIDQQVDKDKPAGLL